MDDLTGKQKKIVDGLRGRYASVHEVVFRRSLSRAKTESELFDILDTLPDGMPLVWDKEQRRWTCTNLFSQE